MKDRQGRREKRKLLSAGSTYSPSYNAPAPDSQAWGELIFPGSPDFAITPARFDGGIPCCAH